MRYCPECGIGLSTIEKQMEYCKNCHTDFSYDNEEDEDDYRDRIEEQKAEELATRAATCKCGAWQFAKDGSVIHVADCCCGAE